MWLVGMLFFGFVVDMPYMALLCFIMWVASE